MQNIRKTNLATALILAFPLCSPLAVHAADTTDNAAPAAAAAATATQQTVEVHADRQRLDAARNRLSPDTGSTVYRFDQQDLARLPQGANTPLNQVILQAPGIVQDSFGQLHVRGDHANVHYRIDGVVIPEAISGFGQALQTRMADRIDILTGALPAQFGYRTAAVVDINTKGQAVGTGGNMGLTLGSQGHREANLDVGGSTGALSYFLTGSLLGNQLGIENPKPERIALHDKTQQAKSFGSMSYLLNADSRVSLMFGDANGRFEIPNIPGQTPNFNLSTASDAAPADSATLDARQRERNRFAALSYQTRLARDADLQVSVFTRSSDVHYLPDTAGELVFNGIAADIMRRNTAQGLQADFSRPLDSQHTLRTGLFLQRERFTTANNAQVFPADATGNQTSSIPMAIQDNSALRGHLWGAYLQDEWQPSKALTINYGLRFDQVRTVTDESQLSPRLGLTYDASPTVRLHAGYARYFTPPPTEKIDTTSVQKFLGTTNALPSDANTAVRAERSNYLDVGLAWQALPKLTLGIDGYCRQVKHLQDEGQFGHALIYSAFNYAQGRVGGLELTATYRDAGFNAYGNLAFSRAEGKGIETGQFNFDDDELAYINKHWVHLDHDQKVTASAGMSYRWAGDWLLSGDMLMGSGLRKGFANSEHLPAYTQFNLSVAKPLDLGGALGKVDARIALINVFDRVYPLRDGSGIGVGAPQFGPRRGVYVSASRAF